MWEAAPDGPSAAQSLGTAMAGRTGRRATSGTAMGRATDNLFQAQS